MIFNESSSKRVNTLIQLLKINSSKDQLESLLEGKCNSEEILSQSIKEIYSEEFKDWSKYIINKPVYNSMLRILKDEITKPASVLKVVTSLLTQIFIRYEKNPEFPLKLLKVSELSHIISNFIEFDEHYNIDEIKRLLSIIVDYLKIGSEI